MILTEKPKTRKVKTSKIALPTEHGSWGILFEPLIGAAAVAPSLAAPFIALMMFGAFLMRQPVKVFLSDRLAGRNRPEGGTAAGFILFYAISAAAGLTGALAYSSYESLSPFLVLLPLGAVQVYSDVMGKGRRLLPEIGGPVAVSSSAMVLALAAGWPIESSLALWIVFVSRSVPSIIYVRQRLRLEKGKPYTRVAPAVLHAAAFAVCAVLAFQHLAPRLPLIVFGLLLARSIGGLSRKRKKMKAMQIGIRETVYGGLLVVSLIVGHYLDL